MRVRTGVSDVVLIYMTLALCVWCTGTCSTEGANSNDFIKTSKIGSTVAKDPLKVLNKSWFEVRVRSYRSV